MSNEQNQPTKKTLEDMTIMEVIEQCGRLKYPAEKVLSNLYAKDNKIDIEAIRDKLNTPGSAESMAYRSGFDSGDLAVESALFDAAAAGDPDAQKALHDIQAERTVGNAIKDRFFPDGDES